MVRRTNILCARSRTQSIRLWFRKAHKGENKTHMQTYILVRSKKWERGRKRRNRRMRAFGSSGCHTETQPLFNWFNEDVCFSTFVLLLTWLAHFQHIETYIHILIDPERLQYSQYNAKFVLNSLQFIYIYACARRSKWVWMYCVVYCAVLLFILLTMLSFATRITYTWIKLTMTKPYIVSEWSCVCLCVECNAYASDLWPCHSNGNLIHILLLVGAISSHTRALAAFFQLKWVEQ